MDKEELNKEELSKKEYVQTPAGNWLHKKDGFSISYNDQVINMQGLPETAIVVGQKFYILYGDHREQYFLLAQKGLDACIDYFKRNEDIISSWSNRLGEDD